MEFWIDDTGYVTYCDGDAGIDVPNHEAVVRRHAAGLLQSGLEALPGDDPLTRDVLGVLTANLDAEGILDCVALRCGLSDLDSLPYDETTSEVLARLTGVPELVVQLALQSEPNDVDPRDYAMEHWGWHRVVSRGRFHTIESWRVTRQLIKKMYMWIGDVEEQTETTPTWTWYVRGSGKVREFELTSADMETGIIPRASVS